MPAGTYALLEGSGRRFASEEFRTAPGIAGSRYFATIRFEDSADEEVVDIAVDADWLPRRVRIGSPGHHLILQAQGAGFVGARDDEQLALGSLVDVGYRSPGFLATTANRLLHEGVATADLEVTSVAPSTLEIGVSHQRFERLSMGELITTPVGAFEAVHWGHTDLDAGATSEFWTAGAVVLSHPGVAELSLYDPVGAGPFPLEAD